MFANTVQKVLKEKSKKKHDVEILIETLRFRQLGEFIIVSKNKSYVYFFHLFNKIMNIIKTPSFINMEKCVVRTGKTHQFTVINNLREDLLVLTFKYRWRCLPCRKITGCYE